jgi:hypothetical protein
MESGPLPRLEMPTFFPLRSAIERISGLAKSQNMGRLKVANRNRIGAPRRIGGRLAPPSVENFTLPPMSACVPTAEGIATSSTSSPSSR